MLTFTSLMAFQNLTIVVYDDGKNETGDYFEIRVMEISIRNSSGAEIIIPHQQMISILGESRIRVPIFDRKYSSYFPDHLRSKIKLVHPFRGHPIIYEVQNGY